MKGSFLTIFGILTSVLVEPSPVVQAGNIEVLPVRVLAPPNPNKRKTVELHQVEISGHPPPFHSHRESSATKTGFSDGFEKISQQKYNYDPKAWSRNPVSNTSYSQIDSREISSHDRNQQYESYPQDDSRNYDDYSHADDVPGRDRYSQNGTTYRDSNYAAAEDVSEYSEKSTYPPRNQDAITVVSKSAYSSPTAAPKSQQHSVSSFYYRHHPKKSRSGRYSAKPSSRKRMPYADGANQNRYAYSKYENRGEIINRTREHRDDDIIDTQTGDGRPNRADWHHGRKPVDFSDGYYGHSYNKEKPSSYTYNASPSYYPSAGAAKLPYEPEAETPLSYQSPIAPPSSYQSPPESPSAYQSPISSSSSSSSYQPPVGSSSAYQPPTAPLSSYQQSGGFQSYQSSNGPLSSYHPVPKPLMPPHSYFPASAPFFRASPQKSLGPPSQIMKAVVPPQALKSIVPPQPHQTIVPQNPPPLRQSVPLLTAQKILEQLTAQHGIVPSIIPHSYRIPLSQTMKVAPRIPSSHQNHFDLSHHMPSFKSGIYEHHTGSHGENHFHVHNHLHQHKHNHNHKHGHKHGHKHHHQHGHKHGHKHGHYHGHSDGHHHVEPLHHGYKSSSHNVEPLYHGYKSSSQDYHSMDDGYYRNHGISGPKLTSYGAVPSYHTHGKENYHTTVKDYDYHVGGKSVSTQSSKHESEHGHGHGHGHKHIEEHSHVHTGEHSHGHTGEHSHGHTGQHSHGHTGKHSHGHTGEHSHEYDSGHRNVNHNEHLRNAHKDLKSTNDIDTEEKPGAQGFKGTIFHHHIPMANPYGEHAGRQLIAHIVREPLKIVHSYNPNVNPRYPPTKHTMQAYPSRINYRTWW